LFKLYVWTSYKYLVMCINLHIDHDWRFMK